MLYYHSEAAARTYDGKTGPLTEPTLRVIDAGAGVPTTMLLPRATRDGQNIFFAIPALIPDVKTALVNQYLLEAQTAGDNAPVRIAFLPITTIATPLNITVLPAFRLTSTDLFADAAWQNVRWGLLAFTPHDQTATITFKCTNPAAANELADQITQGFKEYVDPHAVGGPNSLPRVSNFLQLLPKLKPAAKDDTVTIEIDAALVDKYALELLVIRSMDIRTAAFTEADPAPIEPAGKD
jgi:hypothetical protein